MDSLRRALGSVGESFHHKSSSSSSSHSLCGTTVTIAQRKVKVGDKVAEGGMAVVYRAKDVASGTVVALKQCLMPADAPGAEAAARHEAELHAKLSDHPNVVTLYGREIAAMRRADKSPGIQVLLMARGGGLPTIPFLSS